MKGYSLLNCRHGTFLLQDNDLISTVVRAYGEWAENSFRLINHFLPVNGVAVDVGANVGTLSIPMSKSVGEKGRVYAYEAQAQVFYNLCANILINDAYNVTAKELLIGDTVRSVKAPFFVKAAGSVRRNFGGQSFMPFLDLEETYGFDNIQMSTLDEQLKDEARIDLIKIDVEGAECIVLIGAIGLLKSLRPVLYIECGSEALYEKVRPVLADCQYDIYWHAARHFYEKNFFHMANITGNQGDMNILCLPAEKPFPQDGLDEFCLSKCGNWGDLDKLFPDFQY